MPFPYLLSPPVNFPTYLVPSLSFRRRLSSTDSSGSTSSTTTTDSTASDGYLTGHVSHLRCAKCSADLALSTQIISKGFTGRHGRAYLVAPSPRAVPDHGSAGGVGATLPNLPNTVTHKPVPRQLVTGAHTVGDISCVHCRSVLGWKYVAAEEESQRYKVGKFILETKKVCRSSGWDRAEEEHEGEDSGLNATTDSVCALEFDSQDEDECEDLFLGVWTPQLARKRRRTKMLRKGAES